MKNIAFIGAGNMNGAIISGLVNNGFSPEHIIVSNPSPEKRIALQQRLGIKQTANNTEAVEFADVIVLGVKPYLMSDVCKDFAQHLDISNKSFISVAAGCPLQHIEQALGQPCSVFRTMPNTPSEVGAGVTGIFANSKSNKDDKLFAEQLMQSVGIVKWLDTEDQIDHIIAVSGSAPAYFFLFMEAMEKQAMAYGFSAKDSRDLVQQTAFGAAKMVTESELPISKLRENVTSKGGATHAAVCSFQADNLEKTVSKAMNSAIERAKEMAKEG